MKAKQVRATVLITDRDIGSFLDMLRYDQCTVLAWSLDERTARGMTYRVDLQSRAGADFTIDRWRSFGLVLREEARA